MTAAELPASWRSHADEAVARPDAPGPDAPAFYIPMMAFQGADYDRNAFVMGTGSEVAALVGRLGLATGTSILDVGCGTGRHLRALARDHGCTGVGVDVSRDLIEVASGFGIDSVTFEAGDARTLSSVPAVAAVVEEGGFDVVWTLCQGGFGTSPLADGAVLAGLAAACRPGGTVVVTAFHALFAARHLVDGDAYDVVRGVHHQRTEVRGPDHTRQDFDLWTTAYTVGEIVRACEDAGLVVGEVVGCEPGRYDSTTVGLNDPELLVVARKP
jgi:SAM-dependent methyltransferase